MEYFASEVGKIIEIPFRFLFLCKRKDFKELDSLRLMLKFRPVCYSEATVRCHWELVKKL